MKASWGVRGNLGEKLLNITKHPIDILFKMFFLIYCYSNTLKCSMYRDVLYRDNRCGKLTAICGHYGEIQRVGHGH